MAEALVPDFTTIRGDDWVPHTAANEIASWHYVPYGIDQDLTDPRFQVRGQLRATKVGTRTPTGDPVADMAFDDTFLAQSICVPAVDRAQMALLTPGRYYVGDIQVTDLTGPYGRISAPRFLLYIDYDVTDIPEEP